MNVDRDLRLDLDRWQKRFMLIGGIGAVLCLIGALTEPRQFFYSYLLGYLLWLGIALGSMAILMLHHLVGGLWGFSIQRLLETAGRTLPLLAALFVPVLIGIPYLYEWSRPGALEQPVLAYKSGYLNAPSFVIRSVFYFAIWILMASRLSRWSRRLDETGDTSLVTRMERLSGPGLVIYGVTMTFASVDWIMSLEPRWFSTIFGMIFLVGQAISSLSFVIILALLLSYRKPLSEFLAPKQFHDLGNLLLAFVMLWAYVAFSQFLIIWSGNLPDEVAWYTHRIAGGWGWLPVSLVTLHFAVPFLLLLQRRAKRRPTVLAGIAIGLLTLRLFDLFWIVAPALHTHRLAVSWLDLITPPAIGAIWLSVFLWLLKGQALLPERDPRLLEAIGYKEAVP
jgi:hypothetical protein